MQAGNEFPFSLFSAEMQQQKIQNVSAIFLLNIFLQMEEKKKWKTKNYS
jgi:hypothetical protein